MCSSWSNESVYFERRLHGTCIILSIRNVAIKVTIEKRNVQNTYTTINAKAFLCLTEHHATKTYAGVEV